MILFLKSKGMLGWDKELYKSVKWKTTKKLEVQDLKCNIRAKCVTPVQLTTITQVSTKVLEYHPRYIFGVVEVPEPSEDSRVN